MLLFYVSVRACMILWRCTDFSLASSMHLNLGKLEDLICSVGQKAVIAKLLCFQLLRAVSFHMPTLA